MIGRRAFITLLGGAAGTWPLVGGAQQPAMPVIGILASVSPAPYGSYIAALKEGLRQTGYVEGRNIAIEYRWADGQYDRLPQQAIELVDRGTAVIVLVGGGPTIAAAKAASATIPRVVVSSAMERASPIPIVKPVSIAAEFSRARNLPTCRFCSRPSSSWSST
jgi:putative ABC transport system substrate-binding protein